MVRKTLKNGVYLTLDYKSYDLHTSITSTYFKKLGVKTVRALMSWSGCQ